MNKSARALQIALIAVGLAVIFVYGSSLDKRIANVSVGVVFLVMANGIAIRTNRRRVVQLERFAQGAARSIASLAESPDRISAAKILANLAHCLELVGAQDEVDSLYQRALAILKEGLGEDHPDYVYLLQLHDSYRKAPPRPKSIG